MIILNVPTFDKVVDVHQVSLQWYFARQEQVSVVVVEAFAC